MVSFLWEKLMPLFVHLCNGGNCWGDMVAGRKNCGHRLEHVMETPTFFTGDRFKVAPVRKIVFLELPLYDLLLVNLPIRLKFTAASVLCLDFPNKLIFLE
jgi:hypothetical protein